MPAHGQLGTVSHRAGQVASGAACHDVRPWPARPGAPHQHPDHRRAHRRRAGQGGLPAAAHDARGARRDRRGLRGGGRGDDPPAHPRRASTARPSTPATSRPLSTALREQTSLVVQLSTGRQRARPARAAADRARRRARLVQPHLRHDELRRRRLPQPVAASCRTSTSRHRSARWSPSSSCSTSATSPRSRRLLDTHGLPFGGRVHVDFVTGVPGGMPGTPAALLAGVAMLPAEVTSWSATGHRPRATCRSRPRRSPAGGHLRVGMEDNVVFARGVPVEHNASSSSGPPTSPR